uniref:Putative ovule protein n=1 Tax=Solanum chacoense TaxID=4108 RepID=A0A0V0IWB9_SOLCH
MHKGTKVNAGTVPGADLGPVISKQVKERISKLIQAIVDSGAKLVLDARQSCGTKAAFFSLKHLWMTTRFPNMSWATSLVPQYYLISKKTLNVPRRNY